jgi:hypothetical protein
MFWDKPNKEAEVQAGWFANATVDQIAKESKVSREEAKRLLQKQIDSKLPKSFWDKI